MQSSTPTLALAAVMASVWGASLVSQTIAQGAAYVGLLGSLLYLFQVIGREDLKWVKGLIGGKIA